MTPLRAKMIDAMLMRGYSLRTQQSYLWAAIHLAKYYGRCPSLITHDEIQAYLLHLVKDKQHSPSTVRLRFNGLRFLYVEVLKCKPDEFQFDLPRRKQRIPELLTRKEVASLIRATPNLKQRLLFSLCYGCGLRVGELVGLRVQDVDTERHLLSVRQGKGGKDRQVLLPESLLSSLAMYRQRYCPRDYLFYAHHSHRGLSVSCIQTYFKALKEKTGITKHGGPHALRHAYATHQLAAGMSLHLLKQQLGHRHLGSTQRYLHWLPNEMPTTCADLTAGLEVSHD